MSLEHTANGSVTNRIKFFFVGAPKCGTTSLHAAINKIDGYNVGTEKEPHHFSYQELKDKSYYFDAKFIESEDAYFKNYENKFCSGEEVKAIDFSPSYLANTPSLKRIAKHNPNAKIIIIIRDPVNRALSHFFMDKNLVNLNGEFLDLLSTSNPMYEKFFYEYISNGLYFSHIERFINIFGRDRVHVEIFEELFPLTNGSVSELFEFLDIPLGYNVENVHTNSFDLLNNRLYRKIRQFPWLTRLLRLLPQQVKDRLKLIFRGKAKEKPSMHREKEYLRTIFREDSKKLKDVLNLDVDRYWHWLND